MLRAVPQAPFEALLRRCRAFAGLRAFLRLHGNVKGPVAGQVGLASTTYRIHFRTVPFSACHEGAAKRVWLEERGFHIKRSLSHGVPRMSHCHRSQKPTFATQFSQAVQSWLSAALPGKPCTYTHLWVRLLAVWLMVPVLTLHEPQKFLPEHGQSESVDQLARILFC